MIIYTFLVPILFSVILGGMFVYKSDPSTSIFLLEYADLFFPIVTWNFLILNAVSFSLNNLVEVYGLASFIIMYSFLKYKFPVPNYKYSLAGTVVLNCLPFFVRL